MRDDFVPSGSVEAGQPAVIVGAGAIWMHVYGAVTTRHRRFVQGGGCGTVGVAGLIQGGGFGTYSKGFGTAASSLLEAEVVTADGVVRVANQLQNADLFWALKGGGGGTFGVVTRVALKTHDAPEYVGIVVARLRAASDEAFRSLIGLFLGFCAERLLTPHWGEIVNVRPDRVLDIHIEFQGLTQQQADEAWAPFFAAASSETGVQMLQQPLIRHAPAYRRWDAEFLNAAAPGSIMWDSRPGASRQNFYWSANRSEAGHYVHGFESVWLAAALLAPVSRATLRDGLLEASRLATVELHFQKGLAGASAETLFSVRDTPMNPAVLDAFALAIVGSEGPPAFPGARGHEPDLAASRRQARRVFDAAGVLRRVGPHSGAYVAESSYFQNEWQRSYWGSNYDRLLRIKRQYDPGGVFFVRHGVGSEEWSDDGFRRLADQALSPKRGRVVA